MDAGWDGSCGPRPSSASVQVRELSWQGLHNPCPQSKGPGGRRGSLGEQLVEKCLSPARLRALAGENDLQLVQVLEMCVDTRESSLGNFGVHLPNLNQLKLNGSRLGSLRDLGSSLGRLQVLWLARCRLADLDGVGSLPALKELFVSYNNISDLSPLCLLEHLEVLDLEGNSVEDLGQVGYLRLCPRLATLTLEGNLVCLRPDPGPASKMDTTELLCRAWTWSCPCPGPGPGPPGTCPTPRWSLRAPWLTACLLRSWPQTTTPATSPTVPAECCAGTPPEACGSADSSARYRLPLTVGWHPAPHTHQGCFPKQLRLSRPGLPRSSRPSAGQKSLPPAPPAQDLGLSPRETLGCVTQHPNYGTCRPSREEPQPPGAHGGSLSSRTARLDQRLPPAP